MTVRAPQAAPRAARVPSRKERIVSWTILALLPLIAAAVYLKGRSYDPNLFALNPASLAATGSPRSAAAVGPAPRVARDPELPSSAAVLPKRLSSAGWEADGAAESFTRDTLYQKINGRADAYLQDGFARLEAISYARDSAFIDVLLYDMTDNHHARARFTAERPAGADARALAHEGYCVAASCFLVEGPYYVQVIGSDSSEEVVRTVEAAAREFATLTRQRRR